MQHLCVIQRAMMTNRMEALMCDTESYDDEEGGSTYVIQRAMMTNRMEALFTTQSCSRSDTYTRRICR